MTYNVFGGTLNLAHSLTQIFIDCLLPCIWPASTVNIFNPVYPINHCHHFSEHKQMCYIKTKHIT